LLVTLKTKANCLHITAIEPILSQLERAPKWGKRKPPGAERPGAEIEHSKVGVFLYEGKLHITKKEGGKWDTRPRKLEGRESEEPGGTYVGNSKGTAAFAGKKKTVQKKQWEH